MDTIRKWLRNEFINGQTKTDWAFLILGILTQIIAIIIQYKDPGDMTSSQLFWSSVAGMCGVISVVGFAQRKISAYAISFVQLFTYVFAVAIPLKLWGEVGEEVFYFITMIIGLFVWGKSYNVSSITGNKVKSKEMCGEYLALITAMFIAGTAALAVILRETSDPMPLYDSITTVAPFIGQILLTFGYKEQWAFWIIEDIFSVVMFAMLGNWIMVGQYLFWTANCIYGWVKWTNPKEA